MYRNGNGHVRNWRMPARFSSRAAMDQVIEALLAINQLAHTSGGKEAAALYQLKSHILSAVLDLADEGLCLIRYQLSERGDVLLLVELRGSQARCFHTPVENLDRRAQVLCFNKLGSETAFLEAAREN